MKTRSICFRCPSCRARIKAPVQLLGQSRDCPGCDHPFVVARFVPKDAEPILVLIEGDDRDSSRAAYRRSA